jgi:RimJ/RimL family protein N-acetyltransferase
MWSDPAVVRHIGGKPSTEEEVWSRLLRYAGLWSVLGFGYWAVRDRAGGQFLGDVGLADFRRDISPRLAEVPEIGWALAPAAQGRGVATEAVQAVIAWADRELAFDATTCLIDPENAPSLRVAHKCGYQARVAATYRGHATLILDRVRARW